MAKKCDVEGCATPSDRVVYQFLDCEQAARIGLQPGYRSVCHCHRISGLSWTGNNGLPCDNGKSSVPVFYKPPTRVIVANKANVFPRTNKGKGGKQVA